VLVLENVFDDFQLPRIKLLSREVMNSDAALLLGNRPRGQRVTKYMYKTVQASEFPCLCKYEFSGTKKHKYYQYGKPAKTELQRMADAGNLLPQLTELMEAIDAGLRLRMRGTFLMGGTSRPASKVGTDLPNYVVMSQ